MADTKISALTAATTPLAGTEVLPIVQGGVTKKVTVADLTAGRAVTGLSFAVGTTQNIVTGGMWYQTSGGLLVMSPATTGGFAWNNYANNAQIASLSNGGNAIFAGTLTTGSDILINAGSGNPSMTVKTAGAGNNPWYRLQADTNYWDMLAVFSNTTDDLRFRYNGSDFLTIFNTGGVSIGNTVDPGATNLSVTGTIAGKSINGSYMGAGSLRINASQTKTITVAVTGTPNALQIGFGGDLDNNGAFWGVNYQVNGSMVLGSTYSVATTNSYTSSATFTISAVTKNSNNFTFTVTNTNATYGGTIQYYFISSANGAVTVS